MEQTCVFFDLDGTLTDSGEGITKCAALALSHFGLEVPGPETMRKFVGPPLGETFIQFGIPADKVDEAIAVYRSRYMTVGKYENFPYPGVREMLEALKNAGKRLFVATSSVTLNWTSILKSSPEPPWTASGAARARSSPIFWNGPTARPTASWWATRCSTFWEPRPWASPPWACPGGTAT